MSEKVQTQVLRLKLKFGELFEVLLVGVSLILSRTCASTSDRYERHDINVKAVKKGAKHIGLPPFQLP